MIVVLDSIVEGADIENLPTIEQIGQGYKHNSPMVKGDDHPRLFAWKFLHTDYLIEALKGWEGQTLVDLGCGRELDGYIIAKLAGATTYIAVDPFNMSKFYQRLTDPKESKGDMEFNERIQKIRESIQIQGYDNKLVKKIVANIDSHLNGKHLPVSLIAEDMVTALRRLPDNSTSILAAGLDKCIIWRDEYAELAEEEISRVLHPQGAYLAMCSRFVPKKLYLDSSFEGSYFKKFTKV